MKWLERLENVVTRSWVVVRVKNCDKKVASIVQATNVVSLEGNDLVGQKEPRRVPRELIPRWKKRILSCASVCEHWGRFRVKQELILVLLRSPSETRPINRIGSKLKDLEVLSLNQSASISSLQYCMYMWDLYTFVQGTWQKERSTEVARWWNYSSTGYV